MPISISPYSSYSNSKGARTTIDRELRAKIRLLSKDGMSSEDIQKQFKLSASTVYKVRKNVYGKEPDDLGADDGYITTKPKGPKRQYVDRVSILSKLRY